MTQVFDRCQEFEAKRLEFFKEMLFSIHSCLNISNMPELIRIYEEYRHTIQTADASKDLKYWSNTFGVGMPMNWPQFEVCVHLRSFIIGNATIGYLVSQCLIEVVFGVLVHINIVMLE